MKNFIIEHIDSVGKLEVLLLLARTPEKEWCCAAVTQELRSNETSAKKFLSELTALGLLSTRQEKAKNYYLFRPASPVMTATVAELVSSYAFYQSRIIHLIYNKPIARIEQFADAFKIRKDNDDG